MLALKLQVLSHSSFSSEADIVTTAGAQAIVQGRTGAVTLLALKLQFRSRYCHN